MLDLSDATPCCITLEGRRRCFGRAWEEKGRTECVTEQGGVLLIREEGSRVASWYASAKGTFAHDVCSFTKLKRSQFIRWLTSKVGKGVTNRQCNNQVVSTCPFLTVSKIRGVAASRKSWEEPESSCYVDGLVALGAAQSVTATSTLRLWVKSLIPVVVSNITGINDKLTVWGVDDMSTLRARGSGQPLLQTAKMDLPKLNVQVPRRSRHFDLFIEDSEWSRWWL